MGLDWKPRGRDLVIGGFPWLARITDKARAKLDGTIGDYIYPCPADQKFLEEHNLAADEFTQMVKENPTDEDMIEVIKSLKILT